MSVPPSRAEPRGTKRCAPTTDRRQPVPAAPRQTPRQAGRLELADGDGDSRLFMYLLGIVIGRADRDRRQLYLADLDLASVAETVGLAAIEPVMRDVRFRDEYRSLNRIVGIAGQRAVNALSIADATGIPRETVRRKLKLLVEAGFIVEQTRGRYVIKPGSIQKPDHLAAFDRVMRDVVRMMNECLQLGLVRWTRRPDDE